MENEHLLTSLNEQDLPFSRDLVNAILCKAQEMIDTEDELPCDQELLDHLTAKDLAEWHIKDYLDARGGAIVEFGIDFEGFRTYGVHFVPTPHKLPIVIDNSISPEVI